MELSFISYAGAGGGEPNLHELRMGERRLLLDCGAGRKPPSQLKRLDRPDLAWISHAHGDHCGALLALKERFPDIPVYSTARTATLLEETLAPRGDQRQIRRVQALTKQIKRLPLNQFYQPPEAPELQLIAFDAGHVPGAAMLGIQYTSRGQTEHILYTGDFCTHDQRSLPGAGVPSLKPLKALIMESILGADKEADQWQSESAQKSFADEVLSHDGPCLIGVASLGEALEVAALLAPAKKIYLEEYLQPILEPDSKHLEGRDHLIFQSRSALQTRLDLGGIVIATGDQYQRGSTAGLLASPLLARHDALLILLNRARKKTGSGLLKNTKAGRKITWYDREVPLQARVSHHLLLNHAPRWQLLAMAELSEPEHLILVHGDTGARFAIKRALQKENFPGSIWVPRSGESLSIHGK